VREKLLFGGNLGEEAMILFEERLIYEVLLRHDPSILFIVKYLKFSCRVFTFGELYFESILLKK